MSIKPLLSAKGVAKNYGAVAALRNASLEITRGEIVALMGANGAGKSTLVKILTGAIAPSSGDILIKGKQHTLRSPAHARQSGLVPVYQEPSLIPDLDITDNLRLSSTPFDLFRFWVNELGVTQLDMSEPAQRLPLAIQRVLDLARALASEPDVLLLDEMTAALPADMVDNVLEVIRKQKTLERSVIYISHRFPEIAAVCDRASILRDGETVGDVRIDQGIEEHIVELMLGPTIANSQATGSATKAKIAPRNSYSKPRLRVRNLAAKTKLADVSFDLFPGEVLGVAALEGQGQDELFDILAGMSTLSTGSIAIDGVSQRFRHPADAISAGHVYVPGDRAQALLMQRSVRENITLPFYARPSQWGPINMRVEKQKVNAAIKQLQIDTRAQGEVQRLSGGNQQKATIARWMATEFQTLLCFDPTRGIDIRTKNEIYPLLKKLADDGSSVLLYTSELAEIQRACNRVIVIFGGRVVAELNAQDADEATLMKAAYGLLSAPSSPTQQTNT